MRFPPVAWQYLYLPRRLLPDARMCCGGRGGRSHPEVSAFAVVQKRQRLCGVIASVNCLCQFVRRGLMTESPPQAGWYPDPSDGSRRRYWDGHTWGPVEPTDQPQALSAEQSPKKKLRRLLIFGTIAGIMIVLIALAQNSDQKTPTASLTPGVPSPTSRQPPAVPAMPGIGQEVRDGKFAFVVNSVDRSKTAGDLSNEFETVTAQGEFLNVHMTVSNVGDRTQSFFASNQKLSIGGKDFSANDSAAMWTESANVDINPGNNIQAVVSFDLPANTADNGVLTVHDSAFSGGAKIGLQSAGQPAP
jgi:hypothetical protein